MGVLQLIKDSIETIRLCHFGDDFVNFEQDTHLPLMTLIVSLSMYLSFGLAFNGFLLSFLFNYSIDI